MTAAASPSFPLNAWYAAAYDVEVKHALLARTICNQKMVLFRRTDGQVNTTISYLALLRRAATPAEIDRWEGAPLADLERSLIDSYPYAARFAPK